MERTEGRHLLHHRRWTGAATSQQQRELRVVDLRITVDGASVEVPPNVGIDRVRAVQAPMHTHDTSGQVWLEGRETDEVTLGQFFTVWGVRFDGRCLGSACRDLEVTVDGKVSAAPTEVRLAESRTIDITASS